MKPSIFLQIIGRFFSSVVGKMTEKINGQYKEGEMLHKTMLVEEYSPDLTWNATEIDNAIVAADVVSLDSSLPLKKRGTITHASGTLPKLGIKYHRGEKTITNYNIMIARGTDQATLVGKILNDVRLAIGGMDVKKEIMFQEALSTGMCLVEDEENEGTGVRVSFGYKDENTFHATSAAWGQSGHTPIDDLRQMFDKAMEDGNSIEHVYISKKYFDILKASDQAKQLVANYRGIMVTTSSVLETPTRTIMLEALGDEFDCKFHIVNSSFRIENLDGTRSTVKPFVEANIVGLPTENIGRLVYGTLAEETNPVEGVSYQKSGSHVLVAKFSKTDPLEEFTTAQALVIPVIDNADAIYLLHADSVSGKDITVDDPTATFGAEGGNMTTNIHYDGELADVSASSSATSWLHVSRRKLELNVTADENTGSQRTGTITISAGGKQATIAVTQEAGN